MAEPEEKKHIKRLDVLDGLRGFSIILVFLNHIDSHYIAEAVPVFLKPFIQFLFTSGNLGVTFFFILSGFLMGYLYANPRPEEFIERRYARIFPPFLVMVICMWVFSIYPNLALLPRIALMLSVAFIARIIWIHIVERFHISRLLIKVFIFIQVLVSFWYGFIIMRNPPIWFDSLPSVVREGTIFATNATLTLPLGNYIPLLDGVYWSLAPEMIFYLLYPYLFSPIVQALRKKISLFIYLFIFSLFPFFFGLSLLFKHSQGLTMLFIEYFIYFCGGIGIAQIIKNQEKKKTPQGIDYAVTPLSFLILLFAAYYLLGKSSGQITLILRLLLVFPFGFIVYSLIEHETSLNKLFRKKIFLFLGAVSYSMYIGHTAIVDGMHLIFKPTSTVTNVLFLFLTAVVFLIVSVMFHYIIEKPYFQFKPSKQSTPVEFKSGRASFFALLFFVMFLFFSTYTSQFNFFSTQKKYKDIIPTTIHISSTPYLFPFVAQENNMGVILVHLTNAVGDTVRKTEKIDPNKPQRFQMRMKERGAREWYATQDTAPAEIGNSSSYPFGFPVIVDSKNKTYLVEMSIVDIDYKSTVLFNKDEFPLTTVHQIPKQVLLKNPLKLFVHLTEKIQTAIVNPEAQLVAECISPFFLLLFFLLYT